MYPKETYQETTYKLEKGDRVVLYTDGLTERQSPTGVQFGQEQFKQCLIETKDQSIESQKKAIFETVKD